MNAVKTDESTAVSPFVKRVTLLSAVAITLMFSLAVFIPGPVQKNAYMGAEYCGSCHQQEYKIWVESPHARAKTQLELEKGEAIFTGVQCESCHGPGQFYASLHIKKDPVLSKMLFMQRPAENSCKQCHLAKDFNLAQAMKKIQHWPEGTHGLHKSL